MKNNKPKKQGPAAPPKKTDPKMKPRLSNWIYVFLFMVLLAFHLYSPLKTHPTGSSIASLSPISKKDMWMML